MHFLNSCRLLPTGSFSGELNKNWNRRDPIPYVGRITANENHQAKQGGCQLRSFASRRCKNDLKIYDLSVVWKADLLSLKMKPTRGVKIWKNFRNG
ncbi:hypothetical protein CEXT_501921 [Caerostris extrusa]|uniref:Uncharacterized protein n=1 Tax=Caerostris extrusa TaxID=172846 RepID=A0AAV4XRZ8_CAEEX|nr:hypothetical protein CEXT_501921 [Caerostris extrusa]